MKKITALIAAIILTLTTQAQVPISALPSATGDLRNGVLPIVINGATRKATPLQLSIFDSIHVTQGTTYDTMWVMKGGVRLYPKLIRSGNGSSAVSSVFGRTGSVIADPNDYSGIYAPIGFKTTLDALNGFIKGNGAGGYSAISDNSNNWNTAFSWGDHTNLYLRRVDTPGLFVYPSAFQNVLNKQIINSVNKSSGSSAAHISTFGYTSSSFSAGNSSRGVLGIYTGGIGLTTYGSLSVQQDNTENGSATGAGHGTVDLTINTTNTSFSGSFRVRVAQMLFGSTTNYSEFILSGFMWNAGGGSTLNQVSGNMTFNVRTYIDSLGRLTLRLFSGYSHTANARYWINVTDFIGNATNAGVSALYNNPAFLVTSFFEPNETPKSFINTYNVAPVSSGGSGTVNSGTQYRLPHYENTGTTLSPLPAITGNRALASDANGLPVHSNATAGDLNNIAGLSSNVQTQINTINAQLAAMKDVRIDSTYQPIAGINGSGELQFRSDSIGSADNKVSVTFNGNNLTRRWNIQLNEANVVLANLSGALPTAKGGVPTGGTTGQVLQKNSNSNYDVSWVNPSGGSSNTPVTLLTRTVSAKDTFNIDLSAWYLTYDLIRIEIYNTAPVTDGAIAQIRVSSDGTNYDAGASNYVWMNKLLSSTGFTGDAASNGTALVLSHTDGVDNAANVDFTSTLEIRNPDASTKHFISITSRYANNGGTHYSYVGAGARDAQQILRGIQFRFSTGNISKATIKVIGIQ